MQHSLTHSVPLCVSCNKKLREMIDGTLVFPDVLIYLSSFIAVGIIAVIFYLIAVGSLKLYRFPSVAAPLPDPVPLTFAALLLGMGLGGFIDGIFLHQVLQWHEMLTNKLPPASMEAKGVNMFWDGLFHAFTLVVVLLGVLALWKGLRHTNADKSFRLLAGGFLGGWAMFNLIEGIINHHVLKLHNVRENVHDPQWWNNAFLILSIAMLAAGLLLVSRRYKKQVKNN